MGFYIKVPSNIKKAHLICELHGGKIVSQAEAKIAMKDTQKAVIVVVHNSGFEAAGFAFNDAEFQDFTLPSDVRPKQFVIMDRAKAKELTGYKED